MMAGMALLAGCGQAPSTSKGADAGQAVGQEAADAAALQLAPKPIPARRLKPGNLIKNFALAPNPETGWPDGILVSGSPVFEGRVKVDPNGGFDFEIQKIEEEPENFYHVRANVPVKAGQQIDYGFEFKVSQDYSGEVAAQASLYDSKGKDVKLHITPYQAAMAVDKWQVVTGSFTVPEGAVKSRLYFPRNRWFRTGTVTVRRPFIVPTQE